jgi:hypothetical protein
MLIVIVPDMIYVEIFSATSRVITFEESVE